MSAFGVGMPAWLHLHVFGATVADAFGHPPYMVGSATTTTGWRDVDVRLLLPDEQYDALFGDYSDGTSPPLLDSLAMAYSSLARQMTGLPVDFQIQRVTTANEKHKGGMRMALGIRLQPTGGLFGGDDA